MDRTIIQLTGADRFRFLQGLVSNDVLGLEKAPGIVWAALLTPQGKYLVDFFIIRPAAGDRLLLDIPAAMAADTLRLLSMYRLRANVQFSDAVEVVSRGLGAMPEGAFADPRHPELGWRHYGTALAQPSVDWDDIRVRHCIPESGIELIPNETYLLEAGFERLHGVDFRKGCYVGQEVTARMKHKTELRKGFATVSVAGEAPVGSEIMADGKPAGRLFTQSGGRGIAWLRFDRATGEITAGSARLNLE